MLIYYFPTSIHLTASCGPNVINLTNHLISSPVLSKDLPNKCVWLVTGPNSTRFEMDISTFNITGNLIIGNGHISDDVDSIFDKIQDANTANTLVSSGNTVWIMYMVKTKRFKDINPFRISLDLYDGTG